MGLFLANREQEWRVGESEEVLAGGAPHPVTDCCDLIHLICVRVCACGACPVRRMSVTRVSYDTTV